MSDLEAVVAAVARSKKYRHVCPTTVRRIAARELAHRRSVKEAAKATKRRLHQVYGAFEEGVDTEALYRRLEAAYHSGSAVEIEAACREGLAAHSSTRERLPVVGAFYAALWQVTGRPGTLLDVGCGLNPLALPWMGLAAGAQYHALDIDCRRIEFLNRFLALAGLAPLARCHDVLVEPPQEAADVALLLKTSPSLERQEAGATPHLVNRLRAPYVVVSFAVQSLGGRDKGMAAHYRRQFERWAGERAWEVERLSFDSELVFVVRVKRET
ncbi:MAG: 16S rRNA methyltransferase [Anaerolineae bacterium]|jgi:16S rRNA (guanine(1405)-N(7))-methyltransferase